MSATFQQRFLSVALPFLLLGTLPDQPSQSQDLEDIVGGSVKPILEVLHLEDLDGDSQPLSAYLGKGPLLLDFWATWCKPCLLAMPELEELYQDLHERGLQVVGINEDGPRNVSKVKPFVRSQGFTFPIVLDLNRKAQSRLNVSTLPTTLLLDADGIVVHTSYGYRKGDIANLRKLIEAMLAKETDE
jgi:thiol-disulfide isomerase/thioredoxin